MTKIELIVLLSAGVLIGAPLSVIFKPLTFT